MTGTTRARRAPRSASTALELQIPASVIEALDHYARVEGVSLPEAARFALCCGPLIADFLHRQGVPSADVVGP